jgi:F420-dependent oxidoreductase-like protein
MATATRLRFGIKTAQMDGGYEQMREAWLAADELGFDTAWGHDHLLNQNDVAAPEDEGWTVLAALLAQTRRIRGGLMVTANTFRHPSVLAKIATTVDRISGGRLEVGLGAGWFEPEHAQYGLDLPPMRERLQRLDEACSILKALWTTPRATFDGKHYQVREAYHEPKPVQRPHPPLIIGGGGEKVTLRIAARHATEWNLANGTPDDFRRKCGLLDEHCRAVGRDPSTIARSIQFLPPAMRGDIVARARDFVAAGASHLVFTCPTPYSGDSARRLWRDVIEPLQQCEAQPKASRAEES